MRGYDKYSRTYDKSKIPESTYPDQFFLLNRHDLDVGISKASPLISKLSLPGDRLIALETHVCEHELRPNLRTGRGRFVERGWIGIDGVHLVDSTGALTRVRIEEACALSLRLHTQDGRTYDQLVPRSVSILPVANACQARCPFCFSKASVSAEVQSSPINWRRISEVLQRGRAHGAERLVITGGGEPSLLSDEDLIRLINEASEVFPKVVLISNGFKWGSMPEKVRSVALRRLDDAGLSVLAISRHHFDEGRNAALMNLATQSEKIADSWSVGRSSLSQLRLRWICVLQRGGIENRALLEGYLEWAVSSRVEEICYKDLYVSTSVESEYFDRAANNWSADNQISLRMVLDFALDSGWELVHRLPWGAPIFEGLWRGRRVRVAAYTEPSLFWELTNGICRSWNLMADGRCLASLEDRQSEVLDGGLRELQAIL